MLRLQRPEYFDFTPFGNADGLASLVLDHIAAQD